MKRILSLTIAIAILFTVSTAQAASGWLYANNDDFSFPYRYGQHVLTFGDPNGFSTAVSSFEPLMASNSELTSLFTVRRVYEQKEAKTKLEDIGRVSKIKGVSKQLTETSLSNLYKEGKRYLLLASTGIVYEVYLPKLSNKTQQYWLEEAVKNIKFNSK